MSGQPFLSLKPPYYAVIFTSREKANTEGFDVMGERMDKLAAKQKGYLGIESVRNAEGVGITVSYWQTEEDIRNWKQNSEHLEAQEMGKSKWYEHYTIRVCKVEREYGL